MQKVSPSLSIVIPAYDEEEGLPVTIDDIIKNLPMYFFDWEIIVVDDGSTDKTPVIADRYAKKYKNIHVIHQSNGGYNKAMIAGIKAATKDFVGYFQADAQNLVGDFTKCYRLLPAYDLVMAGRGKPHDYSFLRLGFHYGGFLLYRILFGLTYDDPHWVYFWKTKEVQKLTLDPKGGVFLLVESLVKFRRKGLRIVETTSAYHPRIGGEQKAIKPKVILRTMKSVFRLWWQIIIGKV